MTALRGAIAAAAAVLLGACTGDLGTQGAPTCNARPIDPPGYRSLGAERVEGSARNGHRYAYEGPDGERVTFYFGVTTDAGAALPPAGRLPLATIGAGRLTGRGTSWTFAWDDQFPCDRMRVVGSGMSREAFLGVLSTAGVTPLEEEEGEGAGGGEIEGGGELEEEAEETEGLLPGGPGIEWVAVLDSATDPGSLGRIQRELLRRAPANAAISPASCWKGLPQAAGVPRSGYVAALVALTETELEFAIERVGRAPLFVGRFAARCD